MMSRSKTLPLLEIKPQFLYTVQPMIYYEKYIIFIYTYILRKSN
jgi:hypothetical protein